MVCARICCTLMLLLPTFVSFMKAAADAPQSLNSKGLNSKDGIVMLRQRSSAL